jgi:hypothetical protein
MTAAHSGIALFNIPRKTFLQKYSAFSSFLLVASADDAS